MKNAFLSERKAQPDKVLEKTIRKEGILGACQPKGWFDETVVSKWIEQVLQPYVEGHDNAFLLVDQFSVHMTQSFRDQCYKLGIDVDYIPAGYTCVLQPVDVGFNAQLKHHVRDHYHQWCIKTYSKLDDETCRLPTPERADVVAWVKDAYNKIPSSSLAKTFRSIGYLKDLPSIGGVSEDSVITEAVEYESLVGTNSSEFGSIGGETEGEGNDGKEQDLLVDFEGITIDDDAVDYNSVMTEKKQKYNFYPA